MAVTVYKSTDASAPVLTGETNSLIALFDACLVNGYGSKAGAGWTKAYSGTNKAVYRMGGGTQRYLQVIDDGSLPTAGARAAKVRGFWDMSDVDNGTNVFPTVAQLANSNIYKSTLASNATRQWVIVASNRGFYYYNLLDTVSNSSLSFFGDIRTFGGETDIYHTCLFCSTVDSATASATYATQLPVLASSMSTAAANGVMAGEYNGTSASLPIWKTSNYVLQNTASTAGSGGFSMPNPADLGVHLSPIYIGTSTTAIRGILAGGWSPLHNKPLSNLDTFNGTGGLTGRQFIVFNCAGATGQMFVETSDTWYS